MAKAFDSIKREIKAAVKRLEAATDAPAQKAALADLEAAQRILRAARRDAGETLLPEEARGLPVTMGQLEDLLFPLRDRLKALEGKR